MSREPTLRVVPRPGDINANGHIFGGWVLSQMDIAGGIAAGRVANGAVATIAIESMKFIAPVLLHDLLSLYTEVRRVGRTSIAVHIEAVATRGRGAAEVTVTEGLFTFVAIDADARPSPIPRDRVPESASRT